MTVLHIRVVPHGGRPAIWTLTADGSPKHPWTLRDESGAHQGRLRDIAELDLWAGSADVGWRLIPTTTDPRT